MSRAPTDDNYVSVFQDVLANETSSMSLTATEIDEEFLILMELRLNHTKTSFSTDEVARLVSLLRDDQMSKEEIIGHRKRMNEGRIDY